MSFKTCRRCEQPYKAVAKHSKICPDCDTSKGGKFRRLGFKNRNELTHYT